MDIIKADKISYSYPVPEEPEAFGADSRTEEKKEDPVLNEVSLSVSAGQRICILGRNGSGKSTFARHLNALLVPSEGTLWIDGMDTKEAARLWEIRRTVGMVFQNPDNQIIGSVVEEDVAFGPENLGVPSSNIRTTVSRALSDVGMAAFAKASPEKLSGGQKQRVAVAGILAMHPKCIVLDESTAMLDPKGRKEVLDTVKKLNREEGITIILITHFMEEALEADTVFVMQQGRIAMQGTPREVFSREEEIKALGLQLPQICQLAGELRKQGLPIPKGILTAEELKEALSALQVSV